MVTGSESADRLLVARRIKRWDALDAVLSNKNTSSSQMIRLYSEVN